MCMHQIFLLLSTLIEVKIFTLMKLIFSSVRVDSNRNIWCMHITRQLRRDSSYGTVYTEYFCTTSENMVTCFELWLQLHRLSLKMESHCLMLNTMILFFLQSSSDIKSSLSFHTNTSCKHITSFEVKFYNSIWLMIEIWIWELWVSIFDHWTLYLPLVKFLYYWRTVSFFPLIND